MTEIPLERLKLMILSNSQRAALFKLKPIAYLALHVNTSTYPIKPRAHNLICAASGTGKSYLMQVLGEIMGVPTLHLNVSSWSPVGSRSENYTWSEIVKFISDNPKGIIILDEIDKISSDTSDWMGHVRLEIYDLLDGRIPQSISVLDPLESLW